jgi:galactonate dehydratase
MSWGGTHDRAGFDLYTYLSDPETLKVKDGCIDLLTAPGLGIQVNEALVRAESRAVAEQGIAPFANPALRGPTGDIREW